MRLREEELLKAISFSRRVEDTCWEAGGGGTSFPMALCPLPELEIKIRCLSNDHDRHKYKLT